MSESRPPPACCQVSHSVVSFSYIMRYCPRTSQKSLPFVGRKRGEEGFPGPIASLEAGGTPVRVAARLLQKHFARHGGDPCARPTPGSVLWPLADVRTSFRRGDEQLLAALLAHREILPWSRTTGAHSRHNR
jgi:hypothetical protein